MMVNYYSTKRAITNMNLRILPTGACILSCCDCWQVLFFFSTSRTKMFDPVRGYLYYALICRKGGLFAIGRAPLGVCFVALWWEFDSIPWMGSDVKYDGLSVPQGLFKGKLMLIIDITLVYRIFTLKTIQLV